ncbi:MAG: IS1595 family transposase [Pseudomonadota bacterium]
MDVVVWSGAVTGRATPRRGPQRQSFLRTKAAYTLNVREIARLTEDQAFERFKLLRYAGSGGRPVCPKRHCHCDAVNTFRRWNKAHTTSRVIFKCKKCDHQFTATSGTAFAYRKMSFQDILYAIALFVQAQKGTAALAIFGQLKCQYRVALVLTHKLREAMSRAMDKDNGPFVGEVEADTSWIGGYERPQNLRQQADYKNTDRVKKNPYAFRDNGPTKRNVTAIIERGPNGRVFVDTTKAEIDSRDIIRSKVSAETVLLTDATALYEQLAWDVKQHLQVNHSVCFWTGEANTNTVESFFSGLKATITGVYHRITHPDYAVSYVKERGWRFERRKKPTGDKFADLINAIGLGGRSRFAGVWQRRKQNG